MSPDVPTPAARHPSTLVLALGASVATAGAIAYHRALLYFFSQDDFASLARAAGMLPRLQGPWRYLGNQAIFDVLRPVAGLHPMPYHLASLAAHLACSTLLFALLARRLSAPAALVGGIFFAVHPALFTAVYWISVIADSLALIFALGALGLLDREDRWRWLAVPLFALSLLSKESTLLLPAAAVAYHWGRRQGHSGADRPSAPLDPVIIILGATSAIYLAYFVMSAYSTYFVPARAFTPGAGSESAAYGVGIGSHLWQNFLSYAGWTVNFLLPTVQSFSDAVDPNVFGWGAGLVALWFLGLASRTLRDRGWLVAGAFYLCFLLPVLPLRHHTYHYYLYAPLAGAAWLVAAAADAGGAWLTRPQRSPARISRGHVGRRAATVGRRAAGNDAAAWLGLGVLVLLLTLNGALLVHKIETYPFTLPGLRADPTIDRARIAQNVIEDLRRAALPAGVRLLFWSEARAAAGVSNGDAPGETYWERNVRNALLGGLALRVMLPQVKSVEFVRSLQPTGNSALYVIYQIDGHLTVARPADLDSLRRANSSSP